LTLRTRYIKMTVTYDGSAFFGYQYQPDKPTVQGELERALELITKECSRCTGAGRTDTGVHAVEQIVLFRTRCPIPLDKLIIGVNRAISSFLRVSRAEEVEEAFHPCFSAKSKHYRYLFLRVKEPSPFFERYYWQITESLDTELMSLAAKQFIGEHDFASFAKTPSKYDSTVRNIIDSYVTIKDDFIIFDVIGEGFMHNMVRNLAKALYLIGTGRMQSEKIKELYLNHDRRLLGAPAPPNGLYMMKVMY
jgi:tRNA pseudouridine38-40 synthase